MFTQHFALVLPRVHTNGTGVRVDQPSQPGARKKTLTAQSVYGKDRSMSNNRHEWGAYR
jgi:hypothetical protein